MKIIVHHADGRTSTGGKALGEFYGKLPTRRNGDRMVMGIACGAIDPSEFAEALHQFVAATHRTRQSPAYADVELPGSRLTKARIEGDDFEHFDRLDA